MTSMLFDDNPDPPAAPSTTPAQRLRGRQQATIAAGQHPLNGLPLLADPAGKTCGTCAHRWQHTMASKPYPKCDLGPTSHGPKTDVHAWWPACTQWEPKESRKP